MAIGGKNSDDAESDKRHEGAKSDHKKGSSTAMAHQRNRFALGTVRCQTAI